jgi:hypothetical protein
MSQGSTWHTIDVPTASLSSSSLHRACSDIKHTSVEKEVVIRYILQVAYVHGDNGTKIVTYLV